MAMGSTGTVNISVKMMDDIKKAVDDYRQKAKSLQEQLDGEVNGLVGSSFVGDAADGFRYFYDQNVVPVIDEELEKLLSSIDGIADGAKDALPGSNGLDDQLGAGNRQ